MGIIVRHSAEQGSHGIVIVPKFSLRKNLLSYDSLVSTLLTMYNYWSVCFVVVFNSFISQSATEDSPVIIWLKHLALLLLNH